METSAKTKSVLAIPALESLAMVVNVVRRQEFASRVLLGSMVRAANSKSVLSPTTTGMACSWNVMARANVTIPSVVAGATVGFICLTALVSNALFQSAALSATEKAGATQLQDFVTATRILLLR